MPYALCVRRWLKLTTGKPICCKHPESLNSRVMTVCDCARCRRAASVIPKRETSGNLPTVEVGMCASGVTIAYAANSLYQSSRSCPLNLFARLLTSANSTNICNKYLQPTERLQAMKPTPALIARRRMFASRRALREAGTLESKHLPNALNANKRSKLRVQRNSLVQACRNLLFFGQKVGDAAVTSFATGEITLNQG